MLVRPFYFCLGRDAHALVHVAAPHGSVCATGDLWYLEDDGMVDAVEPEMPEEIVGLLRGRQKRAVRRRANAQTALHTNEKVLQEHEAYDIPDSVCAWSAVSECLSRVR